MNIFFRKAITGIQHEAKLTPRIFDGSFTKMGHTKREPDTRTPNQLLENIDYYAARMPEVAKFKNKLKNMNPKYLGLVSDICELASRTEMLYTSINIRKPANNGKSLFEFLLEKLPKAEKENPESLDLSQEIINNTDSMAAKYTLGSITGLNDCENATNYTLGSITNIYASKDAAKHMKATIPFISDIAEKTLNGGYTMDYSKEENFVNTLFTFISPDINLEKLNFLPKIIEIANKAKANCIIDVLPFLKNETPMSKVVENLDTFQKIDENISSKTINLTDFLEKNVNIK